MNPRASNSGSSSSRHTNSTYARSPIHVLPWLSCLIRLRLRLFHGSRLGVEFTFLAGLGDGIAATEILRDIATSLTLETFEVNRAVSVFVYFDGDEFFLHDGSPRPFVSEQRNATAPLVLAAFELFRGHGTRSLGSWPPPWSDALCMLARPGRASFRRTRCTSGRGHQ